MILINLGVYKQGEDNNLKGKIKDKCLEELKNSGSLYPKEGMRATNGCKLG